MRRAGAIVGLALVVAAAAAYTRYDHRVRPVQPAPASAAPTGAPGHRASGDANVTPRPIVAEIAQIRDVLRSYYYRPIPPEVLALPTAPQILKALGDPYTEYLTPERYGELQDSLQERYFGVGLTVTTAEEGLMVTASLRGPAREAGIRPGDLIISINGRPASSLGLEGALSLIAGGDEGSVLNLTVRRPGAEKSMRFRVVRRHIRLPVLRSRMLRYHGFEIGYIRLFSFGRDAGLRVGEATAALDDAGARAIVLDLRGNPGGLLTQAIDVASVYLKAGVICSTQGASTASHVYTTSGIAVDPKAPLVVLVDEHTASAAEIVAAALQDHGRAEIVGTRTYGKATVQAVMPLIDGGALRLTTATYVTPSGAYIGGQGVRPDLERADNPLTGVDEALRAAEKLLLGRL
jgi:carboxyl-terminal processing protease